MICRSMCTYICLCVRVALLLIGHGSFCNACEWMWLVLEWKERYICSNYIEWSWDDGPSWNLFRMFFCVLTRKDLTKCFNDEGTRSCFDSHPSISLFLSQAYFTLMYLLCLFSLYLCVYFCNTFIYLYSCEFLYVPRYALFRIYYLAFNGLTSSVG